MRRIKDKEDPNNKWQISNINNAHIGLDFN